MNGAPRVSNATGHAADVPHPFPMNQEPTMSNRDPRPSDGTTSRPASHVRSDGFDHG